MPRAKADQTLKKAAQKLASASRASGAAVKKAAAKVAKTPTKASATPAKAPAAKSTATKAAAKPTKAAPATKATKATKATTVPTKAVAPATKAPTKAASKAVKATKTAEKAPIKTAKSAAPARPEPVKKAPVKAKKHVLDKFEIEQKELLLEERAEYVSSAEALKAEADQLAAEMEPGDVQFDEESGEGGTSVIDRERDLAMSAQARVSVEEIDHALAKLAAGNYGPCENCGQPIPKARLKALPHARLCVACKSGGLSRR
jgi:DnaK suppressor protein